MVRSDGEEEMSASNGGDLNEAGRLVHDADALHRRLFTIDTHIDTPTASLTRSGWDFGARHDHAVDHTQCDLPRMREGGIDAMVFAVYVGQAARTAEGLAVAHDIALRHFARTHEVLREHAAACGLALTAEDGLRLKAEGKHAIYLSIENAYSIGRDVGNVAKFHALGVRMIGLTHMLNNDVADASTDPRGAEWGGLSPLGREMVAECNRIGIVLDASHASDEALRDLLEVSRAPVVLSHSGPRALCDHPRNVGDELLRALAAKGGVLQINALPISLVDAPGNRRTPAIAEVILRFAEFPITPELLAAADREYDRVCAEHPNPPVTLDDFIRHIEHAVAVMGIDHVGIGCDFDGGGGSFDGLRDVADYPNITRTLVARGWDEGDLAKLWGGNTLRVLRAAASLS
ncbi:MAG: membrane dipeptidase [Opitutus sp.]|nr:membrane dipeptidase [Opitutus sp.]